MLNQETDGGAMRCADESRKAMLCLVFSVSLVCTGLLTLSLLLYHVVRYQAHGAWHFHPARCTAYNISSSTLQQCAPHTRVCLQSRYVLYSQSSNKLSIYSTTVIDS